MISKFVRDAILAAMAADITILDGADVGLFTNSPDLDDPDIELADFTAANFTGYAAHGTVAADWDAAVDTNGNPYLATDPVEFQPTNAANLPQVIRGVYYFNGAELLRAAYFATPLVITQALQLLHVVPAFGVAGGDPIPQEGSTV